MEKNRCYVLNHEWRFISYVETEGGARYTLTICPVCGTECRQYDNGGARYTYYAETS